MTYKCLDCGVCPTCKCRPMTPEELREQTINWVVGNVGMSNPDVTREVVEEALRRMGK